VAAGEESDTPARRRRHDTAPVLTASLSLVPASFRPSAPALSILQPIRSRLLARRRPGAGPVNGGPRRRVPNTGECSERRRGGRAGRSERPSFKPRRRRPAGPPSAARPAALSASANTPASSESSWTGGSSPPKTRRASQRVTPAAAVPTRRSASSVVGACTRTRRTRPDAASRTTTPSSKGERTRTADRARRRYHPKSGRGETLQHDATQVMAPAGLEDPGAVEAATAVRVRTAGWGRLRAGPAQTGAGWLQPPGRHLRIPPQRRPEAPTDRSSGGPLPAHNSSCSPSTTTRNRSRTPSSQRS
jgi:hypothetical protein